jgi:HEAT repeat protein
VDALAVCGAQSADQVGPILLRILKSRKSSLDQACTRALTELGSAAVPYLTDLLADKDPALRAIGVATIGGLRPIENKVLGMVGTLTEDPSPLVRGAVLSALTGALRDGALVPLTQLLRFAEDPTGDIRAACAAALGTLPSLPPEGAKSLVKAMEDQDKTVRRTAIGSLHTHSVAASKYVPEIAAKLTDSDPHMRQLAIETLGDIGQPALDVLPQLVAIAKNPAEDPNIRHWAAESAVRIARFLPKER